MSQQDGVAGKELAIKVSHPETTHQNFIADKIELTPQSCPLTSTGENYKNKHLQKGEAGGIWANLGHMVKPTSTNNKQTTTNPTNSTTSKK